VAQLLASRTQALRLLHLVLNNHSAAYLPKTCISVDHSAASILR
jgi:hypothetical protein